MRIIIVIAILIEGEMELFKKKLMKKVLPVAVL
jgi:hypothetical protein